METLELIVKIIAAIFMIVALYYIVKIALMILTLIAVGAIGCGVVALLIGSLIAPSHTWIFGLVGAAIGAIGSIVLSLTGIKEIASAPFASKAIDEIGKTKPTGTKYKVRNPDGSTQIMTKTGSDMFGNIFLKDENGKQHTKSCGSNTVE